MRESNDLQNYGLCLLHSGSSRPEKETYHTSTDISNPSMDSSVHNSSVNIPNSSLIRSLVDSKFGNLSNLKSFPGNSQIGNSIDSTKDSILGNTDGNPNDSFLDSKNGILVGSPVDDSATSPVKIILYTYFRSGSSFTGEMFARDKDTFYLFEPVDGMYSELYGTHAGMLPLDILYYSDGTKR